MNFFKKKLNTTIGKNDNFINPKVLEVNLVRDEVGIEFNWSKHIVSLFLTLLVASLFVAEIYYGLDWWQKQEKNRTITLNAELQAVTNQVKKINNNAKDFTTFKDKLALTKQMADTHVYWTDFFNWLEKNTLNSVSYGGFSGDTSGSYSLSANAKTFSDISWQVKAFKDDKFVDSVRVDSGSSSRVDEETSDINNPISFAISLKVKPQIFFRQSE